MFYQSLKFPKFKDRPFFYTNFVQTIDGKVSVKKSGYWPIGSKMDHQVLEELRAYADCLIHGGNLAREFGEITLKSLNKSSFKSMRRKLGKSEQLPYYVVTKNPQNLRSHIRSGKPVYKENLVTLLNYLREKGYQHILVEGGPTLLGSFLKENLINEIFLTIAPKIYGSDNKSTLSLVEGILFPAKSTKKLKLLSVKQFRNELYLRYEVLS